MKEAGEAMKKHRAIHCTVTGLAIVSFAVLAIVGCSSKSVLDENPDGTISITVSPDSVGVGSTVVVEATVQKDGEPLADQVVGFACDPVTAGSFSPEVDTTGSDGVAASVFTTSSSGSVEIWVVTGGGNVANMARVTVTQTQQSGSGNIDVTVSPSLLLANGSDTSVVTVTVQDDVGQPAPDSTLIKITAGERFVDVDENGYWSEGIDSLVYDANGNEQWDAIGIVPSTALTTGGTGTAVVNYIAGSDALTVYIKATVDDNGIKGFADASLQLSSNASINSIYLASDSINLVVKQTGGIETALLYATGYDINGNSVPEGLVVNFIITDGPGGGERLGTVGYGPYQAVTNCQGVAMAPIQSGTISGTIRIRAYADTILSNATQVMVSAGPPAYIVVGSEFCNVDYWDDVCDEVKICAVVSDIYLNPVNDSTVVYFTTDEGTMKSHEERTKDMEGMACTKWIAGTNVPTADGRVLIIAETAGGTVIDTGMFYNSHLVDTLIVQGVPAWMPADGATYVTVRVSGYDFNGNPVIGGTTFRADAKYLSVQGGTLEDGCYSASDQVKITSTTLNIDKSLTGGNDDGIGAYDTVYYWKAASAVSTFPIQILTFDAYRGNCSVNGLSSVNPGGDVYFSVTIKDRFGNPLGDHTLNMIASGGTVSGATQETDGYGEANGFIWTAPAIAGDYTITVTDVDPRGSGIALSKTVTVEE